MDERVANIDPTTLLQEACRGNDQAVVQILEHYRPYLAVLARLRVGRQFQAKFDDSDLVQETMSQVQRALPQFRGTSEAEFTAWLRRVLASVNGRFMQHYSRQCRDVVLERQLDDFDRSSQAIGQAFVTSETSPSENAAQRERAVILSRALARLPADYREVLILHRLEGLKMADVAARMGRSVASVQKLFARGLVEMRRLLEDPL